MNLEALEAARQLLTHKEGVFPVDVPKGQRVKTFAAAIRRHLPHRYALIATDGRRLICKVRNIGG